MTVFERWTLYLTAIGVLISVGMQVPDLYYRYFRTVRSLFVVPLEVSLGYTGVGIQYLASISFINNGNEDVILREFRMLLTAKDLKSSAQSTRTMELPWKISPLVLRAGEEATYEYEGGSNWQADFLRCSREEPNLSQAMHEARLRFAFNASTLRHPSTVSQYIEISLRLRRSGQLIGGSQAPFHEDFVKLRQKGSGGRPKPPQGLTVPFTPPC